MIGKDGKEYSITPQLQWPDDGEEEEIIPAPAPPRNKETEGARGFRHGGKGLNREKMSVARGRSKLELRKCFSPTGDETKINGKPFRPRAKLKKYKEISVAHGRRYIF